MERGKEIQKAIAAGSREDWLEDVLKKRWEDRLGSYGAWEGVTGIGADGKEKCSIDHVGRERGINQPLMDAHLIGKGIIC